jgi:hypothetical protein
LSSWINDHLIYNENSSVQIGCDGNQWSRYGSGNGDFDYDPSKSTLYGSYSLHCKSTGRKALSKDKFSNELMIVCDQLNWSLDKKKDSKGLMVINGVRLRGLRENYPTVLESLESQELAGLTNNKESENTADNSLELTQETDNTSDFIELTESESISLDQGDLFDNNKVENIDKTIAQKPHFPTEDQVIEFFIESNEDRVHIVDLIAHFEQIDLGLDTFNSTTEKIYLKLLSGLVAKGKLTVGDNYYRLELKPEKPRLDVLNGQLLPTEDEVVKVLQQINDYIDYVDLSMVYFDGCRSMELRSILNNLVDRGICEIAPLDSNSYKLT